MKLNSAMAEQEKMQNEVKRVTIDKAATERIINNTLGAQIRADEKKRQGAKNMLSSDSEDDKEKDKKKVKRHAPKLISKPEKSSKGASRKEMHGATVVPVAAHIKYR